MKDRPNKNYVLQLMRDDDFADPWGTGMSWLGGVCDVLYDADPNLVPAQCQYRPGFGGPEVPGMTFGDRPDEPMRLEEVPFPASLIWVWAHDVDHDWDGDAPDLPYWNDPTFTHRIDVLVEAAVLLDRYLNWCRLAGRDY